MKALFKIIPALLLVAACAPKTGIIPLVENPVIGQDARYCNPLPMEIGPGGNASGDVTVMFDNGKYYMVCSGGGTWVSDDLLNWKHHVVDKVPGAPDLAKFNGKYYMCGNDSDLFVADDPLGPYTSLGYWKNTPSVKDGWNDAFDTQLFVDDDNTPYLFYAGRGVSGLFAVKLDPNDLTRFDGPCVNLVSFNNDHIWERYGERNEYPDVAWVEGPWVYKYNGRYYLQYSASGTQWKSYAEGYYYSDNVMGPYTYASNNPLLQQTTGAVTGTGHGSMIVGPDGNLWEFYTTVLSSPPGGRRIGMDRVFVDDKGELSVKITDTPQWAPGVVKDPRNGDSGSLPLTVNKVNAMNALSSFSSEKEGKYASYAVDDYTGTWWEPEDDDVEPYLMIDLQSATRFDVSTIFKIDGLRLLFGASRKREPGVFNRWRRSYEPQVYKYKLEASMDGENFTTVLDCTENTESRNTIFNEIVPTDCRFVKLTMIDWPRSMPFGIIEFTVFGKASGSEPAKVAIPDYIHYE